MNPLCVSVCHPGIEISHRDGPTRVNWENTLVESKPRADITVITNSDDRRIFIVRDHFAEGCIE
eukprot:765594-Hanusia_phi.AAC.8